MLLIGIFLGTLVVHGVSLRANCQKLAAEQTQLEEKKKSLEKEKEDIEEKKEYMKTDKYIEEVAREKFGLVYNNEIIFKAAE
jgi:cell division protein DivIC